MTLRTYEKNIVCLEALWDISTDEWISVAPVIEFIANLNEVKFTHLTYDYATLVPMRDTHILEGDRDCAVFQLEL